MTQRDVNDSMESLRSAIVDAALAWHVNDLRADAVARLHMACTALRTEQRRLAEQRAERIAGAQRQVLEAATELAHFLTKAERGTIRAVALEEMSGLRAAVAVLQTLSEVKP
jgi:signal transduction protein with GAF and PtsI domain